LEYAARSPLPHGPVVDAVLLRSLPLACFFYADTPKRIAAVMETALAAQGGALGALGSVALAALLAESILSPQPHAPLKALLEAMQRDMAQAAPALLQMGLGPAASIHQALASLHEDINHAQKDSPNLYGPALNLRQHAGYLRVSFRLALWELFHAPEEAPGSVVEDVIRRGGSPSSQGALVACLCGARWGKACLPRPGEGAFSPSSPSPPPSSPVFQNASFLETLGEALVAKL